MKRHSMTAVLALCTVLLAAAVALADAGKPKAVAPEPIKDAGVVSKADKITHDFVIRNEGNAPLEITEVRPACGCTVASFDKTIAPGQTGKVHVVVDTATFSGPIAKGVTAFTNDTENPQIELTVRADVQPVIAVKPGYARYTIVQAEAKEGNIIQTLWATDGVPFEVTKVESPYPFLAVAFHEAKPDEMLPQAKGRQWKVEMKLDRNSPVGALADYVRVTTTHPKQKLVEIPVSGFVRPMLVVTPPTLDYGELDLKQPFKRNFIVKAYSTEPVKVTSVEGNIKGMDTQLLTLKEGREYQVHTVLNPGMPKGPFSGKLTIHTDSPKKPVVEVDLKGTVI